MRAPRRPLLSISPNVHRPNVFLYIYIYTSDANEEIRVNGPAPTTRNWPCFEYSNGSPLKPSENRATKTRRGLKERSRRCEEKTGTNVTMCGKKRILEDPPFVCAKNCTNILIIRPLPKQTIELINPDSLYIHIYHSNFQIRPY